MFLESITNYKYHLWYLPAYITVLFISPIIVKIMDDKDEELIRYLIIVFVIFGSLSNTISVAIRGFDNLNFLNNYIGFFSTFMTENHIGYFVLGRWLINYKVNEKSKKIIWLMGGISTICLYYLTTFYSGLHGCGDDRWLSTLNIFVLMQAMALFIFFLDFKVPDVLNKLIRLIAPTTFVIYLVHVFFLDWSYRLGVFNGTKICGIEVNCIVGIPLRVMIIYLLSYVVSFIWMNVKRNIIYRKIV